MRRSEAFFIVWVVSAQLCGAEPQQPISQNKKSQPQAPRIANQPLLKKVFQSQYSKDQLAQFKGTPNLEQLVRSMSKEQRQAARESLAALEAKAKTPGELAQIARGYLMLDEQGPGRGQNVFRVAAQLEQLDPGSPVGPTLAAEALFQMGDYPTATKTAQEALRRNPDDPSANAIFNLSVGRSASSRRNDAKLPEQGAPSNASAGLGPAHGDSPSKRDSELPVKLRVQGKRDPIVVPSLLSDGSDSPSKNPPSLPFLPLAFIGIGLAIGGIGIYRASKRGVPEDLSREPPTVPASPRGILDIGDDYVARAKTFVQDHPIASVTAGIVALAVIIRLGGPAIAAGGGFGAGAEVVLGRGGVAALGRAAVKILPMPAIEAWWIRATAAAGTVTALRMEGDSRDSPARPTAGDSGNSAPNQKRRVELLERSEDPELRNAIDNLYREKATVGDGSSMDAVRYERQTGIRLSRSGHTEKLITRRDQLVRILRKPGLSAGDRQIAKDLLVAIQKALSGG